MMRKLMTNVAASVTTALALLPNVAFAGDGHPTWGGYDKSKANNVDSLLKKGEGHLYDWVGAIIIMLGVVAIGFASYKLVTGLMSHGKKEVNWVLVIAFYVVGGIFVFGGWALVAGMIGGGLYKTAKGW